MKVLVTVASKHGSTTDIARRVGQTLSERGLDVTVAPVEEGPNAADYGAVVVGSAVYAGHWLKPAMDFLEGNRAALNARLVWLFSSGPIGSPQKPTEDPADISKIAMTITSQDHKVFAGRLDKAKLSFPERAIVWALGVADGDYRDWEDVRNWSNEIADRLLARATNGDEPSAPSR